MSEPIINGDGTRGPSTDPEVDNAAAQADVEKAKKAEKKSTRNGAARQARTADVKTSASKRFTIKSPNTGFTGVREGVVFANGEGEGSEAQATVLAGRGYQVAEIEAKTERTGADRFPAGMADLDLRNVAGIDWPTAVSLADAGVGNVSQLAAADVDALAARSGRSKEEIATWQAEAKQILAAWESGEGELRDKKPGEDIAPASMTPVNPPSAPAD